MLRTGDNETEILLGNKQLLGIFFVVAVLLGVAFYGGYMVGKAAPGKKTTTAADQETASTATSGTAPGETHTLPGDTPTDTPPDSTSATEPPPSSSAEPPLGTPKGRKSSTVPARTETEQAPAQAEPPPTSAGFVPQPGQEFLQVAAVSRDEALRVAAVLHEKGFAAHAVPKPGNPNIYRVLIGPLRDAGDLSATRDALRKTGFRDVITQKY